MRKQALVETIVPWLDWEGGAFWERDKLPFRETTRKIVEHYCGPAFVMSRSNKRYQVLAVRGYSIGMHGGKGPSTMRGSKAATTTWVILDSLDCWREVEYITGRRASEKTARKRCRELNRAEAADAA